MAEITKEQIEAIVSQVVQNVRDQSMLQDKSVDLKTLIPSGSVVFSTVGQAVAAAKTAQAELMQLGKPKREGIVAAIRQAGLDNALSLAQLAVEDTGMGVVDHKRQKNEGAASMSPGMEDLISEATTGDDGTLLIEYVPFGVINSITPTTNPTSTVINHAVIMVAAGNSIVFSPHPNAQKCTVETMRIINDAIVSTGGPPNLLTAVQNATLRTAKEIMDHDDIAMVVATGGSSVVRAALTSGKKAITAGPGNPPAVIDESADLTKAAKDVITGTSFDNNLLCIGEKSLFVVDSVANDVMQELKRSGGYLLSANELRSVETLLKDGAEKDFIGKDATVILNAAEINASADVVAIIAEVNKDHIFVIDEYLMPILPVVRVQNFDDAVKGALVADGNRKHTAMIHTNLMSRVTRYAQALNVSVLVANAPSTAGAGFGGEGFLSMTIAGPTGEGFTRPRTFTQQKRLTLTGNLSLHTR
ncbi:TPA: aldehyde dehydrogenase family protein [Candidatus Poribacteria bacterium]|nr:aldehyde dehydrogenase family protein [Candidatus Poribacteria bacterium]HIO78609.1 aldehyde dehydrogenase family protein [Candidatus Poribacteria bacterium]